MEDIDRFLAKPKDIEILGKTYSVTPLTVNELGALNKSRSEDPKEKQEGSEELGYAIFKKIVPSITKEQFKNIDLKMLDEVMIKFLEVFGDKKNSAEKKIIEKIKGKDVKGNTNNSE